MKAFIAAAILILAGLVLMLAHAVGLAEPQVYNMGKVPIVAGLALMFAGAIRHAWKRGGTLPPPYTRRRGPVADPPEDYLFLHYRRARSETRAALDSARTHELALIEEEIQQARQLFRDTIDTGNRLLEELSDVEVQIAKLEREVGIAKQRVKVAKGERQ